MLGTDTMISVKHLEHTGITETEVISSSVVREHTVIIKIPLSGKYQF